MGWFLESAVRRAAEDARAAMVNGEETEDGSAGVGGLMSQVLSGSVNGVVVLEDVAAMQQQLAAAQVSPTRC